MSLAALQNDVSRHRPPWQFRVQQSVATLQSSPRLLQTPTGPGSAAQAWSVQMPEQHSFDAWQGVPVVPHRVRAHVPLHFIEQQSAGRLQFVPSRAQTVGVEQVAVPASLTWHTPEQHGWAP